MIAIIISNRLIYVRTESTTSLDEPKNFSFQSGDSVSYDFIFRKTAKDISKCPSTNNLADFSPKSNV